MRHFQLFICALLGLAAISCNTKETRVEPTAPVCVRLSDFSISMDTVQDTKAVQNAADYSSVKQLTLAFYSSEGAEVFKAVQLRSDPSTYTTFGEFSTRLAVGTYTLVAVGCDYWEGDEFTLTSPTQAAYVSEKPRETFCATQEVTITSSSAVNLSVTMNRINAKLVILSSDGRPSAVTQIRTTYTKGGRGFNPSTGLATSDLGFSVINIPSSMVDNPIGIFHFAYLSTDEETMDIVIDGLDADDNVLYTTTVPDVPLKRNRQTTLTGNLFSTNANMGIKLEVAWGSSNSVNF